MQKEKGEALTEIAAALGGAAIGESRGDVLELGLAGNDVVAEGLELRDGALSGGVPDDVAFWILPRGLTPRALVLHQYVRCPKLTSSMPVARRRHLLRLLLMMLILLLLLLRRRHRRLLPLPIGLYLRR